MSEPSQHRPLNTYTPTIARLIRVNGRTIIEALVVIYFWPVPLFQDTACMYSCATAVRVHIPHQAHVLITRDVLHRSCASLPLRYPMRLHNRPIRPRKNTSRRPEHSHDQWRYVVLKTTATKETFVPFTDRQACVITFDSAHSMKLNEMDSTWQMPTVCAWN